MELNVKVFSINRTVFVELASTTQQIEIDE